MEISIQRDYFPFIVVAWILLDEYMRLYYMKLLYLRQIADVSNVEYLYSHIRYFGTEPTVGLVKRGDEEFPRNL